MLFIYCYIVGCTFFILGGTYKLLKKRINTVTRVVTKTKYVTERISKKEIRQQLREKKDLRDRSYEAVYSKCKEISEQGEVNYFSLEDIWSITEELKHNK